MVSKAMLDEVLSSLRKAIEGDKRFFIEAQDDPKLQPIREHVNSLLNQLTQETKQRAERNLEDCLRFKSEVDFNWNPSSTQKDKIEQGLSTTKALIDKASYFDYLDAEKLSEDILKSLISFLDETSLMFAQRIELLKIEIQTCDHRIAEAKYKLEHESPYPPKPWWLSGPRWRAGVGTALPLLLLLYIPFGLWVASKGGKVDDLIIYGGIALVFVIPIIVGIFVAYRVSIRYKYEHQQEYLPVIKNAENKRRSLEDEISRAESTVEKIRQIRITIP